MSIVIVVFNVSENIGSFKERIIYSGGSSPLRFMDSLGTGKKRIMLLHEKPRYAKIIQFRFIKNGLMNGERCFYLVHENDNLQIIEDDMKNYGINVDDFKTRNLLLIHQVLDVTTYAKDPLELSKLFKEFFDPKSPFRLVIEVNTEEENNTKVEIEAERKNKCGHLNGMILFSYHVKNLESKMRDRLIKKLMQNHYCVIFVSSFIHAMAIETRY